jgi:hypothetical protein
MLEWRKAVGKEGNMRFNRETAAIATMPRTAASLSEARAAAMYFLGKPLTNQATGMVATVSRNTLDKMTSASAPKKSISGRAHSVAVANADHLFLYAELVESHSDRGHDRNIGAVHRFYAPMESENAPVAVKLTVKALENPKGNRIYSVEAVQITRPSQSGLTPASEGGRSIQYEGLTHTLARKWFEGNT